ncbi:LysR family transcriptional regulator [Arthrobacter sp. MYb211]|uniref:LysR family transcriptional regulator n=1 Tax=unclassified Arthrobacter TaxID=235627 RepID=UPI000CFB3A31|nr:MULTISPECIES: LysR family transcriptional regulator [unclassified Arthrobacter]PRA13408.1 LysR family transcriptional regulator [Arthrobacter sp. MYb221]PRC10606.1 LysR family transcriptional regulator [Arthrobacter sp. MYb211]
MELHQLRILRELADLGSVNAVAKALYVSPSAVSQHLAQLQRGFPAALTQKDGRRLVLTAEGKLLASAAASVASTLAEVEAKIRTQDQDLEVPIHIAGFHSIGQTIFAPLLTYPEGELPPLRFSDEDVSQQDFPALTSGYDLVLAHRMPHTAPWPEERIAVIPLAFEPLDIAIHRDHPLAAYSELSPEQVIDERWVVSRSGFSPADVLETIAALAGRAPMVEHRVNDYATAGALIEASKCLGILPRYTARNTLDETVILRPIKGLNSGRQIDLLLRAEHLHRGTVNDVINAIRSTVQRLVIS